MVENALALIGKDFPLQKLDAEAFSRVRSGMVDISVDWYDAGGLGNLSVVLGKGAGGLMKMKTLVLTPTKKDMPLFSFDYIDAMGRLSVLIELYDTSLGAPLEQGKLNAVKQSVSDIPDRDLGEHWYDNIKLSSSLAKQTNKKQLGRLEQALSEYLRVYLELALAAPPCDEAAKKARCAEYVDGLLKNGGPSTDAFKKIIGGQKTEQLFTQIIFGTK